METSNATLVPTPPPESVSPNPSPLSFEAVKERIWGTKNKSPKAKSPKQKTDEPTQKELDEIFAGENWEEISGLYFSARFSMTGWEGFLLSKEQKAILGASLGTMMKTLLKIDPGYIALIIFTTNFGGIIATKELQYKTEQKKLAKSTTK